MRQDPNLAPETLRYCVNVHSWVESTERPLAQRRPDRYAKRVIVQQSDDEVTKQAAENLRNKHPKNTEVVTVRPNGELEGLDKLAPTDGKVKVQVVGHGDPESGKLGGADAQELAGQIKQVKAQLGDADVSKVALVGCRTACGADEQPSLKAQVQAELVKQGTAVGEVKGRETYVKVEHDGRKSDTHAGDSEALPPPLLPPRLLVRARNSPPLVPRRPAHSQPNAEVSGPLVLQRGGEIDEPIHMSLAELKVRARNSPPPVPRRPAHSQPNAEVNGQLVPQRSGEIDEPTHMSLTELHAAQACGVQNPYLTKIALLRDEFRGRVDIWPVSIKGTQAAHIFDSCKGRISLGSDPRTTLFIACHGKQDADFSFSSPLPVVFAADEGNVLKSSGSLEYADELFDLRVDVSKKETSFRLGGRNISNEHYLSSGIRATPEGACDLLNRHGNRLNNRDEHQPLSILLIDGGKNNIRLSDLIYQINNKYAGKFSRIYGYFCRPSDGMTRNTQSASNDLRESRQNRMTILNK